MGLKRDPVERRVLDGSGQALLMGPPGEGFLAMSLIAV